MEKASRFLEGCLQQPKLNGVVEKVQGIGRKVIRFSEVAVSMALSAHSLKCQAIDAW